MYKHICFILTICTSICISYSFAENNIIQPQETYTTIDVPYLNFNADYTNGKVLISWDSDQLNIGQDTWMYWKVLTSQTNTQPLYPEISAIQYSPEKSFNTYTHWHPPAGKNYYRVCAITKAASYKRYCSPVQVVDIDSKKSTTTKYTYDKKHSTSSDNYRLSASMKYAIDSIFATFVEKLEDSYSGDIDSQIARIEKVITALDTAKDSSSSTKIHAIFGYFGEKLEEHLALLILTKTLE